MGTEIEKPADLTVPDDEDDDEDFVYVTEQAPPVPEQVSSLIAIIRIVSVLGMGLCISFGLFIMLVGVKGVIIGLPIILLSIPCYYGMQYAEKLAMRADQNRRETSPSD